METADKNKVKIGCGLGNINNTCFLNASFQALFHTPILTACFWRENMTQCKSVISEVQNFYQETKVKESSFFPFQIYRALGGDRAFSNLLNGRQQDAHEFLKRLIEQMANPEHPQVDLAKKFMAKTNTVIKCYNCEMIFKNEGTIGDFILDIQGKASVEEALMSFFDKEVIEDYKCINCLQIVLASKKHTLVETPECMMVVLNRFSKRSKTNCEIKNNDEVVVKTVTENGIRQWKYQLMSTINHIGQTYKTGHYTTIVRSGKEIFKFDDANIRSVQNISGRDAYILFYELVATLIEGTEEWVPLEIIEDKEMEFLPMNASENSIPESYSGEEISTDELEEWIEIIEDDDNQCVSTYDSEGIFPDNCNKDAEDGVPIKIIFDDDTISDIGNGEESNLSMEEVENHSDKIQESSRRIVDTQYVLARMQEMFQITCKKCGGAIVFQRETRRGLNSRFHFTCTSCSQKKRVDSCPKDKQRANNNEAAVTGIVSVGLGYYQLEEFLTHFNIPCMSYQTFYNIEKSLQKDWWKLAKKLEDESLSEEIRLAKKCGEVDSAGNPLISVKVDGSWPKRSYGNNFSSLAGCAAIMGVKTNKVLFSDTKRKYCHVCKIATSNDSLPRKHECNANWTGSSTGMENAIIVEGFQFCAQKGARFHKFIGDGDSSTYKSLRDLRLYQNPTVYIEKFDCIKHLEKNHYKKFVALEHNKKFKPNSRKLISDKIGLDICKGVRMAAKHWNESDISVGEKCRNLEKDCMNAPLHCLGVHDECSDYFCTKTTAPEARERLSLLKSEGLYYEILSLTQHYFANKAKSLLAGFDTNSVEGFNSLICKFLGAKRVDHTKAGSYDSRTAMSSVHLNSGYHGISTFQKFKYGKALPETVKIENKRKRKVKANAIRAEENKKRRKVDDASSKTKEKGYASGGYGAADVDLTPEQFDIAKKRFLERIDEYRFNRDEIIIETQQQKYCTRYCQLKQDLLTSSYFGRILHSRSRHSYKKIVDDILYHNSLYTNTADQNHQRLHQAEALKVISQLYSNDPIKICGIFVDEKYSFLGASPYRLIGRDGIVVIKCPRNAYKKTMDEAIKKKLITFWTRSKTSEADTVNVENHWYMQIQGQLHVSKRKFALLMVYLGPSEFKIERIDRDDEFWKTRMETELVYFFNEAMLKELVDSRHSRSMELRSYDEKNEIFV